MSSPKKANGPLVARILRAIADGQVRHQKGAIRMMGTACGSQSARELLARMAADELIVRKQGGELLLGHRGRALLPAAQANVMRPYQPPKRPPVRDGALAFRTIPSLAADREYGWRNP